MPRSTKKEVAMKLQFLIDAIKSDDEISCLAWPFGTGNFGYGIVQFKKKAKLAHRVAFCLKQEIDLPSIDGLVVRHKCDNPICFNPNHLEIGTQADNVADMHARNRNGHGGALGSKNFFAKLNEEDVVKIKLMLKDNVKVAEICSIYSLTKQAVYKIKNGELWKHVAI